MINLLQFFLVRFYQCLRFIAQTSALKYLHISTSKEFNFLDFAISFQYIYLLLLKLSEDSLRRFYKHFQKQRTYSYLFPKTIRTNLLVLDFHATKFVGGYHSCYFKITIYSTPQVPT